MVVTERIPASGNLSPDDPSKLAAIQVLELIRDIPIDELQDSADSDEFFKKFELGKALAEVVEMVGVVNKSAAGYKHFSGSLGDEDFLATHYPEMTGQSDETIRPAFFQAFIYRRTPTINYSGAPINRAATMVPITIPLESGIPKVSKHQKDRFGRLTYGESLEPPRAMGEIQNLAYLMAAKLLRPQT